MSEDPDPRAEADRRLAEALEAAGASDPRAAYRELLKRLRAHSEEEYDGAVESFHQDVVAPVAGGEREALEAWIEYGRGLAERLQPGRTVAVDATGRSRPFESPADGRDLLLHLPEERKERAVPLLVPGDPSPAQQAAFDLLVVGKVRLPET